jgi:hypothetical protein
LDSILYSPPTTNTDAICGQGANFFAVYSTGLDYA